MGRFVVTPDAMGVPMAQVPLPMMWDLSQMISLDTLVVAYQHATNQVLVNFPGADVPTVQRILEELGAASETASLPMWPALHSGQHALNEKFARFGAGPDSAGLETEEGIQETGDFGFKHDSTGNVRKQMRSSSAGNVLEKLRGAMRGLTPAQQDRISRLLCEMKTQLAVETSCFRTLFELTPDGYVSTDLDGNVQYANKAIYDLLRISAARLEGQTLLRFFTPSSQILIQKRIRLFHTTLCETPQVNDLKAQISLCDDTLSVALRFVAIKCNDAAYSTIRWLIRALN